MRPQVTKKYSQGFQKLESWGRALIRKVDRILRTLHQQEDTVAILCEQGISKLKGALSICLSCRLFSFALFTTSRHHCNTLYPIGMIFRLCYITSFFSDFQGSNKSDVLEQLRRKRENSQSFLRIRWQRKSISMAGFHEHIVLSQQF